MKKLSYVILGGALLALLLWGAVFCHHLFVTELNPFLGTVFIVLSVLVTFPIVLWGARRISMWTPWMAFASGALSWLVAGSMMHVLMGNSTLDIHFHDTYYVVSHFNVVNVMIVFMGVLAGIYYWLDVSGYGIKNRFGFIHFWTTLIGCYLLFWPESYRVMPRRYIGYSAVNDFSQVNGFMMTGVMGMVVIQLVFVGMVVYVLTRKRFFKG